MSIAGDSIEVSGRLWNGGDAAYEGWITIDLLLDNRVIDSTRQDTQVGVRTDVAYSARFRAPGSNGTYSARVTVE